MCAAGWRDGKKQNQTHLLASILLTGHPPWVCCLTSHVQRGVRTQGPRSLNHIVGRSNPIFCAGPPCPGVLNVELCRKPRATWLSPALARLCLPPAGDHKPCQNEQGWDVSPMGHPPPPQQDRTSVSTQRGTLEPPTRRHGKGERAGLPPTETCLPSPGHSRTGRRGLKVCLHPVYTRSGFKAA